MQFSKHKTNLIKKDFLTCNEMNVAEEYCWAMKQAARRPCYSPSGSSVVKFGFHIHCVACTYRPIYSWRYVRMFSSDLRKSLLSLDLLNVITAFSQGVSLSYVYRTVHHLDSWVKRDQLEATCFIITLFSAQHVSDVNTSILRSLQLIRWVTSWVVSGSMYVGVTLQCGYHTTTAKPQVTPTHIEPDTTHEVTQRISRKLLRMDVLSSETCWALNKVILNKWHQVGLSLLKYLYHLNRFSGESL